VPDEPDATEVACIRRALVTAIDNEAITAETRKE
jgi:hypothetical protein